IYHILCALSSGGYQPTQQLSVDHNRRSKPSHLQGDMCCHLSNKDYDCAQPASTAVATMCLKNVSPRNSASCFGYPKRVEPPASTTAATLIGRLRGLSAGRSCGCTNVNLAFAQETTATVGKDRGDFGHD